jgi:hypothetical protein
MPILSHLPLLFHTDGNRISPLHLCGTAAIKLRCLVFLLIKQCTEHGALEAGRRALCNRKYTVCGS